MFLLFLIIRCLLKFLELEAEVEQGHFQGQSRSRSRSNSQLGHDPGPFYLKYIQLKEVIGTNSDNGMERLRLIDKLWKYDYDELTFDEEGVLRAFVLAIQDDFKIL